MQKHDRDHVIASDGVPGDPKRDSSPHAVTGESSGPPRKDWSHSEPRAAGPGASPLECFAKQGIAMRRLGEWGWCRGWMLRLGLLLACTLASHAVQFHPNQSHTFSNEDQLFKV